ncbi:Uncharacterised protein [Serratia quinivorans]|jgi:hypothetical protein|nr:Uncharacterised protein [Serratia quinivorans]CAI1594543.1 Uncharacterised protein [Serratia quinivorans]
MLLPDASYNGWVLCRNQAMIEDATMQVIFEIYRVPG